MFNKKKTEQVLEKKKNVFTINSDDAKQYLSSIIRDVKTILTNDKYMEATKKFKLPDNATIKDYEKLIKKVYPEKIYNYLALFIDECYDEVRRIFSAVFITDFEEYRKKSLIEMCEDLSTLSKNELSKLIGFFLHLGR